MEETVYITVTIPEQILDAAEMNREEFGRRMKAIIAIKYYEEKKLSVDLAALLAEMTPQDFLQFYAENRVSIFGTDEEREQARLKAKGIE